MGANGAMGRIRECGVVAIMRANSPDQLLAAIRDEAHRFAIEYHRTLRSKGGIASGIEQIAGAMQSLKLATAQGLASTRQTEKAAQDLNGLAKELSAVIAVYQA